MRVGLYARYSSDNQRDASIDDQLRLCRIFVERQGWTIAREYSDHAISGATLLRPGFQSLMKDALQHEFDVVLAESLDRFSRDQEDTAGLFKRLTFVGIRLVTLAEGEVGHLHVGFKGTMNALYLKDLADKTRRGLRGRIEAGKSGGGLCYGYRVVRSMQGGELATGEREVEPSEAEIIVRIFREFSSGLSPKEIAKRLNREGVAGPFGSQWSPSTIHGHHARGTGILNNELYVGRLVWNRLRYIKNPDTGKRVSRPNPRTEWVTTSVPGLRIVDDELWTAAKERQESARKKLTQPAGSGLAGLRRPRYLFSSLTRCGECGAGYITIARNRLGCFGASSRGTCTNHLRIRRDEVEQRVLKALTEKLLRQELFEEFCNEFTKEMNRLVMEHRAEVTALKRELQRLEARRAKIVESIMEGVPGREVKDELIAIGARRDEIERQLATGSQAPPLLHPVMADLYREKVTKLAQALERPESRPEATEAIRGLIDEIRLIPADGALRIELKGNLAAMLGAAQALEAEESGEVAGADRQRPSTSLGMVAGDEEARIPRDDVEEVAGAGQATPRRRRGGCGQEEFRSCRRNPRNTKGLTALPSALQIALVAGAGFEPATFGL